MKTAEVFHNFAKRASTCAGTPWAFLGSVLVVVLWGATGPLFGFSDTWQLVINTGTTIVTFLMVFRIQNTQNRDAKAVHIKLDELIASMEGARNRFVNLETATDDELAELEEQFKKLRDQADAGEVGPAQAIVDEIVDEKGEREIGK